MALLLYKKNKFETKSIVFRSVGSNSHEVIFCREAKSEKRKAPPGGGRNEKFCRVSVNEMEYKVGARMMRTGGFSPITTRKRPFRPQVMFYENSQILQGTRW